MKLKVNNFSKNEFQAIEIHNTIRSIRAIVGIKNETKQISIKHINEDQINQINSVIRKSKIKKKFICTILGIKPENIYQKCQK